MSLILMQVEYIFKMSAAAAGTLMNILFLEPNKVSTCITLIYDMSTDIVKAHTYFLFFGIFKWYPYVALDRDPEKIIIHQFTL